MTISSSAALPARSPSPLMVPSTWRAPLRTPYSVLATAMPRSSWQCTLMTARTAMTTVHADDGALDARHILLEAANQRAVLFRHRIAGGVGDIDHGGSGGDDGSDHFKQVVRVGAPGVFGVELDVIGELARQFDGIDGHGEDRAFFFRQCFAVPFILELAADVNIRGADSGVDAGPPALRQGFTAGLDVGGHGAGEGAD